MNEATIQRAYEIIKNRARWWEKHAAENPQGFGSAIAYESALCILRAGLDGDTEILNQYDDYNEN